MSAIYNFLELPIRGNGRQPVLRSCCSICSLKAGCRIIALFEALISGIQIYLARQEIGEVSYTSSKLQKSKESYLPLFVDNPYFSNALDSLVLLNSLILVMGAELSNIPCLILWICITILSKSIDVTIHLMQGNDLTSAFFLCTSLIIKLYFCAVVASLILQIKNKFRSGFMETEVLYTQAEDV
ncbi:uncharacterized protein LOC110176857 [Drosophila serrata]|uniref:uncharacterized protein LOC110176857 n=1 Tax=Drosophila serrata TaxID=7274 RepID=UPI000A1D3A24|nr:uncharacterized protein LOC110176857 [Drosophila serrata]